MMKREFYYPSKDALTQIHAIEWIPEGGVRGILQIVHGMVEYIDRYDGFASFMASHGFYVVGNDHLGHGSSVTDASQYGYIAEKEANACLLEDLQTLRETARARYPDVPYFVFGHSMGSFLTREFIGSYGAGLSGAIISGTGYQPPARLAFGIGLTSVTQRLKGEHFRSRMIDNIAMGSYNASFEPVRTRHDWLTKDESVVDAYEENPLNQFMFTVNGYDTLFRAIRSAQSRKNLNGIPKDLPLLVVSGGDDPVGDFGRSPRLVAESFRRTGIRDVTLKLYHGDRHEILNELDRETVFRDLLQWIEERM